MGLYRLATHTTDLPEGFVYSLLATPTSWLVNLTGAYSYAHGAWITFTMTNGHVESLGISTGCAGLESLFLFISGFIAFLLVENQRFNRRIAGALVIGIFTAYFANLLRMTIIVLAGVNYGRDAMLAVHENAGTLIFLGWIAVFWYLMYVFVIRRPEKAGAPADDAGAGEVVREDGLLCENCEAQVDPANIPDECPNCGQKFDTGLFCERCGAEVDPGQIPDRCASCGNPFGK
jgi:exosortase/archaeosortase family protein